MVGGDTVGSWRRVPPVAGFAEAGYLDNVSALGLEHLPRSMVVIGSGLIGCEFARFGSRVEVVSASPGPLPGEEPEVSAALRRSLEADGVGFHGGSSASRTERRWSSRRILGGHVVEARGEELLVAAGRAPSVNGLALENASVEVGEISRTVHVYPTLPEVTKKATDGYYHEKLFTDRNRRLLSAFFGVRRRFFR